MPVLHITDLFNPPGDPDDHFDLLTLLSQDLPVAGVIIDYTVEHGVPGLPTVAKAAELFGRKPIPCMSGLVRPLESELDTCTGQPEESQAAVEFILSSLNACPDGSMIFTIVGSLRDVAAAYNRNPELFHAKTRRIMANIGDSRGEIGPKDWNTALDLAAWKRIMTSGLPIDWFPCNPSKGRGAPNGHTTWWGFPQDEFLSGCPAEIREFFDEEGISSKDNAWRHMWSTASIWEAARLEGASDVAPATSFEMRPAAIRIADDGTAVWSLCGAGQSSNVRIFTITDTEAYQPEVRRFLAECLAKVQSRAMSQA